MHLLPAAYLFSLLSLKHCPLVKNAVKELSSSCSTGANSESSERVYGLVCVVFMVAARGVKKDGRKPSALEELFGSASDSEASTFYGFEDAEAEDVLFTVADEEP